MPGEYFDVISSSVTVGGTQIPVSDVNVRYSLNEVPTATIKTAVGTSETGGTSAAPRALAAADYMTPVVVSINDAGSSPFAKGETTVFTGFVTGPRADATAKQSVGSVVDAEGILGELRLGNKLSWLIHNSSPGGLFEPTTKGDYTGKEGRMDGSEVSPVGPSVVSDLWTNGILLCFRQLATLGNRLAFNLEGPPNTRALAALTRLSTSPAAPLSLANAPEQVVKFMEFGLSTHIFDISSGSSFWDTLITLCDTWAMAIVPRVSMSYVVPVLEAASVTYKTVSLSEMFSIVSTNVIERANCRGVALVGQAQSFYGQLAADAANQMGFVGFSDGAALGIASTTGQIKAYQWPECYGAAVVDGSIVRTIPGGKTNFPTIRNTAAAKPESAVPEVKATRLDSFMDKVAEARLRRELASGKICTVVGPLRFDICPGSHLEIELPGGDSMYGMVNAVEIRVNAEQPSATTQFELTHLKTTAQMASAAVSATHPIFGKIFVGDTL